MSDAGSEILMFQVGARVYATQVDDVRSIACAAGAAIPSSALGEPLLQRRAIVVDCGEDGDQTLLVDQVLGVRQVAQGDLRPLPPLAAECLASGAVAGLALVDEAPMLLIDLPTLIREELRGRSQRPAEGKRHA